MEGWVGEGGGTDGLNSVNSMLLDTGGESWLCEIWELCPVIVEMILTNIDGLELWRIWGWCREREDPRQAGMNEAAAGDIHEQVILM